jgi:hypothetical protein
MALEVIDETAGKVVCIIPNGTSALLGINGAADSVQLLAISGNVLFKSTGIVNTNLVRGSAALPTTGTVTTDGSGIATVSTTVTQPVITQNADTLSSTSFTVRTGSPSTIFNYSYW